MKLDKYEVRHLFMMPPVMHFSAALGLKNLPSTCHLGGILRSLPPFAGQFAEKSPGGLTDGGTLERINMRKLKLSNDI